MGKIMISECKFLLEDEKEFEEMEYAVFMWVGFSAFEAELTFYIGSDEAIEKYMDMVMMERKYVGPPDYLYDLVQQPGESRNELRLRAKQAISAYFKDHPGVCPGYCPNPGYPKESRSNQ